MFNPLLEDTSKLKDDDLEKKILDLGKKYQMALRMGQGGLAQQIIYTLDIYKTEYHVRQAKTMKTLQDKQNKQGIDDLINVD